MCREMRESGIQWIGKIPQGWKLIKYKYFATSGMGETILSERLSDDGVPVYSATQSDKVFGYLKNPNLILKRGDLVIPARGNSIGCVSIIKDEIATCTQTTIYSRIDGISREYLYYCCNGLKDNWFEFDNTAIPQITVNQVQNNIVPVPEEYEQIKIANYLNKKVSQIDDIILKQKSLIEKYKAYKQSLITETVTKGLNKNVPMKDSGIEWIGEIPSHWNVKKMKYLGSLNSSGVDKKIRENEKTYKSVHYVNVYKNGQKEIVNSDNYLIISCDDNKATNCTLVKGDVLFTNSSETAEDMGASTVVAEDLINTLFGYHLMRFRPYTNMLWYKYEKYLFSSNYMRKWFEYNSVGMTRFGLAQRGFSEAQIIYAPYEEQKEIANFLDKKCTAIDSAISKKEELIEKLESYKKSLIYECVTGKREVN